MKEVMDVVYPIPVIVPSLNPIAYRFVRALRSTAGIPCRVVLAYGNYSASQNRNRGLELAQGAGIVAMVDDDIEFPWEDWLRVMLWALRRPEVVMVSAQLYNSDRQPAYMTGLQDCGLPPKQHGETVVPSRRLLTACCAFKPSGCRFDERYVGSGFEDIDFCNQLAAVRPDGLFMVCHDARAVHRNEAKNQRGSYWKQNEALYREKWGQV